MSDEINETIDNHNLEEQVNAYTSLELKSLTSELVSARLDLHHLLMVLRFQAYLAIPLIIGYILYIGKKLLIPILISFVLAYLIMLTTKWFEKTLHKLISKSKIFRQKDTSKYLFSFALFLSLLLSVISLYFFIKVANSNVTELVSKTDEYHTKLQSIVNLSAQRLGIQDHISWAKISAHFHIGTLFSTMSQFLMYIFSEAFSILLYTVFLIASWRDFHKVIMAVCRFKGLDGNQYMNVRDKINTAIQDYLYIKIIVSLLTASISLGIMICVGLDFAIFWTLLIFFLNFIPTVGSIIAFIIPSLLGLIQFDLSLEAGILTLGLMLTQFVIGNIIEPRMMGHKLNLNTFMIIVFLAVWGKLWGIIGMLLCVPIMVIMLLVFKEFEATGAISIMLSSNGEIFTEQEASKGSKLKQTIKWLTLKKAKLNQKNKKHTKDDT